MSDTALSTQRAAYLRSLRRRSTAVRILQGALLLIFLFNLMKI